MPYIHPESFFCSKPEQEWAFDKLDVQPILFAAKFSSEKFNSSDFLVANIEEDASVIRAVEKRRAEFLAGRICARDALFFLQKIHCNIPVNKDRSPAWPKGITGSIAHSKNLATAVVAKKHQFIGVGVDIQETIYDVSISKLVLTHNEHQNFSHMQDKERYLYLTAIFSIKECLFKALHPIINFYFDFQDAEITNLERNKAEITLNKKISRNWRPTKGFVACYTSNPEITTAFLGIPS